MKRLLPPLVALFPVVVHAAPAGYFDLEPGVTLETGETWVANGERFRLYGIQSCLRGTMFTDKQGQKQDCGSASLAMFGAFIKDTRPICAPVAKKDGITFVVCYATIGDKRLDLANVLVTSGYAFASLNSNGLPYHVPYAVSEQAARKNQAGLWQFRDVRHPAVLLSLEQSERMKRANR